MKNSIKLFLLLCLLLAIGTLTAGDRPHQQFDFQIETLATEPFVPFIDLLQDGESYHIEIVSLGCFNGSKQVLTIFRETDAYSINFQDTVKPLNASEIEAIRDFELQLHGLSLGGCSTVDTYKLVYGTQVFRTSDGTCSFNGGRKLLDYLGLISSK
ncbi:hypothetical protein FGM00_03390 [Aggregatimonas sangjinii]|uniref:Excinuclease ABC subunit A n=1 Tax=Aggregatimonas sangjinii TaxID=2583587 RepID=A0A5B7SKY6_9FLAO|nr:hypothetical protein [Aggregatimonas sangjinii]QCW99205.1 hypothetical protein FGM00_03390 [Aggregatimonas sangjinii]